MKRLWMALVLVPPCCVAGMMGWYALDFPMLDQWETVPLLQQWEAGTLSMGDFWAQHNEHRPVLSRLVVLPLAVATRWEVRWEPWLSFACAVAWFGVLARVLWCHAPGGAARWMGVLLLSVLLFSGTQWQNFLLGWQFQLMLGVLLSTVTLVLLSGEGISQGRFALAVVCAVGSTFTFGNGALLWLVGGWMLIHSIGGWREKHRSESDTAAEHCGTPHCAAWIIVGLACVGLYAWGWKSPAEAGGTSLLMVIPYVLAYLGAPMFPYHAWGAMVAGAVGLGLIGAGLLPRRSAALPVPLRNMVVGLTCFVLLSAALTALARGGHGLDQALSSRYATFAILLWLAVVLILMARMDAKRWTAAAVLLVLAGSASLYGAYRWSEHANAHALARPALLKVESAPELRWVYPDEVELLKRAAWLKERGYGMYRD